MPTSLKTGRLLDFLTFPLSRIKRESNHRENAMHSSGEAGSQEQSPSEHANTSYRPKLEAAAAQQEEGEGDRASLVDKGKLINPWGMTCVPPS